MVTAICNFFSPHTSAWSRRLHLILVQFRIFCSPIPVLSDGTSFVLFRRGGGGANKSVQRKTAPLSGEARSNCPCTNASLAQAVRGYTLILVQVITKGIQLQANQACRAAHFLESDFVNSLEVLVPLIIYWNFTMCTFLKIHYPVGCH